MTLKQADDQTENLKELNLLLAECGDKATKQKIKEQISDLEKGIWGEKHAAYLLDFEWKDSKNCVIIHDLRLELNGRVAQIDHLRINRFREFHVIESKNWHQLTVAKDGSCTTTWDGRVIGVESPLEQCKRHSLVLTEVLKSHSGLASVMRSPKMIHRVLVAPRCNLKALHHPEYMKADAFVSNHLKAIEEENSFVIFAKVFTLLTQDQLHRAGCALLERHKPLKRNWRAYFNMPETVGQPPHPILELIPTLADAIPRWDTVSFVLARRPSDKEKTELKAAGYKCKREGRDWVWRNT